MRARGGSYCRCIAYKLGGAGTNSNNSIKARARICKTLRSPGIDSQPDWPVRQPHAKVNFIPPVSDYELGLCRGHTYFIQCCGSVTFWYGSGARTSYYRIRILLFSSVTFKMATKNYFVSFLAYYF